MKFDTKGDDLPHNNGYEDLAFAIILSAVKDYKRAYIKLHKVNKEKKKLLEQAKNYPNVFLSGSKYKEAHRKMHADAMKDREILNLIYRENFLRTELGRIADKENEYVRVIRECEAFFNGSFIDVLTDLGGKNIKARIDYELMRRGFKLLEKEQNNGFNS